jgi:zinc transport system ATP-binding protein
MSLREPLVEARAVRVAFDGRTVLDRVDVALHPREIVTLVGLNGSGKSTLVRVLIGLLRPDAGEVRRRAGLRIGYSPQSLHIDPTLPLTVAHFLTLGARAPRARLQAALAEVGAAQVLDQQVARVSGGELHRVLLARALLREPDLLVLDEPLSGVDVAGQVELYRLIATIRDRRGCGVLLVSHDLHLVMAATDRVVCLAGHVCCTGHPTAVARDPAFVALFGRQLADTIAIYAHHHDHRHDTHGDVVPLQADAPAGRSERAEVP